MSFLPNSQMKKKETAKAPGFIGMVVIAIKAT